MKITLVAGRILKLKFKNKNKMNKNKKSSNEAHSEPLQQCSVSGSYTILDEIPKEGD